MEYENRNISRMIDCRRLVTDFILQHPISAVILFLGAGKTAITLTAIEELRMTA